ncbi:MAG: hypothetical protein Q8L49_01770 [Burkholderiaceae bacterium]|nr:hypothetical protein [Burkholderiaceae bacterium]
MKNHPAVVGADAGALADLGGLETQPLAHHEDTPGLARQAGQATVQHRHHLLLLGAVVGLLPGGNGLADWRQRHPATSVLSTETGFERDWCRTP